MTAEEKIVCVLTELAAKYKLAKEDHAIKLQTYLSRGRDDEPRAEIKMRVQREAQANLRQIEREIVAFVAGLVVPQQETPHD